MLGPVSARCRGCHHRRTCEASFGSLSSPWRNLNGLRNRIVAGDKAAFPELRRVPTSHLNVEGDRRNYCGRGGSQSGDLLQLGQPSSQINFLPVRRLPPPMGLSGSRMGTFQLS